MSLAAARALRAKKGMARRLAASRERKRIFFIVVYLIGVPISRAPVARQCSNTGNVKNPRLCASLRGNLPGGRDLMSGHARPTQIGPEGQGDTLERRTVQEASGFR